MAATRDDQLHVTITTPMAHTLWLETEKPTRRELAQAVADRVGYELESGKRFKLERPKSSAPIAVLVSVAEYLDFIIQERQRVDIADHAQRAAFESVPSGLTNMASCMAEFGFGGTPVPAGPLASVIRQVLLKRVERAAARLLRLLIEEGHLERT